MPIASPMRRRATPVAATAARDATLIERVARLEARIAALERTQATHRARRDRRMSAASAVEVAAAVPEYVMPAPDVTAVAPRVPSTAVPAPEAYAQAPAVSAPAAPARRVNPVWAWFTGGNVLTRIGVVALFFGIAFLLRLFAEHFTVPIEARLAAVAIVGVALIGLGIRLAAPRPGYGLSLQGAGAGILYLTAYAAFRLYAVLPDEAAMALLFAIAALTVWLASRADSQAFAGLAIAGGFLAPMLTSTRGAPLPLFGYFAILNGAIFALAWRRAWRALNVLGFVFTFALGLFWGERYYASEHFATVEPFLVLFFAYYVAIAVLEARRGALEVRRPVDGLLVFGVPLAGMVLQAALVSDYPYGAAWSALALAAIYGALHARAAPPCRARARAARAGVSRARGHLRHARGAARARRPVDGGTVGDRSRRRLLGGRPAGVAGWRAVSRCWSSWAPVPRSSGPVASTPTSRCSPMPISSAPC